MPLYRGRDGGEEEKVEKEILLFVNQNIKDFPLGRIIQKMVPLPQGSRTLYQGSLFDPQAWRIDPNQATSYVTNCNAPG